MYKSLNPFYLEESKKQYFRTLPKFGDSWEDHKLVTNPDHHDKQMDLHAEEEDYHTHAADAMDDYVHNPYKSKTKNQNLGAAKEMMAFHKAKAKFHNTMFHNHRKASEKYQDDYYPGKPRSKGDKAEFVTPPSKK